MTDLRRFAPLCSAIMLLCGCAEQSFQDLEQFVAATKAASPGKDPEPLPKIEPYQPFIYTAQALKDPFEPSAFVQQPIEEAEAVADSGIRPDMDRPREELEKYALGSLQMVGTFRAQQNGTLWALIRAPDGIVHRVKEGNYMGRDYGRIDRITEQRIELTEIVPDGRKGWMERENSLLLRE